MTAKVTKVSNRLEEYRKQEAKFPGLKGAPDKVVLSSLPKDKLYVGKIIVTRGGSATLLSGEVVGWGFDRCKIVEITDTAIKLRTAWGTEFNVSAHYCMYDTTETKERQEFPLLTKFTSKEELTLEEAIQKGLTEIDDSRQSAPLVGRSQSIVVETKETKPDEPKTKLKVRRSGDAKDEFHRKLVDIFSAPKTIAGVAEDLATSYQNIRNALHRIVAISVDGKRFSLVEAKVGNKNGYQLVEINKKD